MAVEWSANVEFAASKFFTDLTHCRSVWVGGKLWSRRRSTACRTGTFMLARYGIRLLHIGVAMMTSGRGVSMVSLGRALQNETINK